MIITDFYTLVILLILLVVLIYFEIYHYKNIRLKRTRRLFQEELDGLMLKKWDKKKFILKKIIFLSGLFFLILALADIRWGRKNPDSETPDYQGEGVDIIIAVDVSKSMLATDLKPNRLENARAALKMLLGGESSPLLAGNRVGVVAFAGSSFVQCPLTTDISAAGLFLDALNPDIIPLGGTDIGGAIKTSIKAFGENVGTTKAIILITDGEDNEGYALETAREAAAQNIRIYPIGIGSVTGETVPEIAEDGSIAGVKKDRKGNIVISRLDVDILKNLADTTGGIFFVVSPDAAGKNDLTSVLGGLLGTISSLPRHKIKFHLLPAYGYKERFQIFLFLGLACLAAEFIITDRKTTNEG